MRATTLAVILGSRAAALAEPSQACDEQALQAAAAADLRMREAGDCLAADLALLAEGVRALDACAGEMPAARRWLFPVAGIDPAISIGGAKGDGFRAARARRCYAAKYPGHPAHDIFVPDRHPTARDREGQAFLARAVEDGLVLVAREGWTAGDKSKGGNYVLLYLPARKAIVYYAHLESVAIRAGQHLARGDLVGVVGRTGLNAARRRSPTHLHFGFWDAGTFVPRNSYPLLVEAEWRGVAPPLMPEGLLSGAADGGSLDSGSREPPGSELRP